MLNNVQENKMGKMKNHYIAEMETRICGIPCIIGVTYYNRDEGSWDCPPDSDVEYEVLDRKGYPAAWLERKMSPKDETKLYEQVMQYMY
jgi:hypothetical protein